MGRQAAVLIEKPFLPGTEFLYPFKKPVIYPSVLPCYNEIKQLGGSCRRYEHHQKKYLYAVKKAGPHAGGAGKAYRRFVSGCFQMGNGSFGAGCFHAAVARRYFSLQYGFAARLPCTAEKDYGLWIMRSGINRPDTIGGPDLLICAMR